MIIIHNHGNVPSEGKYKFLRPHARTHRYRVHLNQLEHQLDHQHPRPHFTTIMSFSQYIHHPHHLDHLLDHPRHRPHALIL